MIRIPTLFRPSRDRAARPATTPRLRGPMPPFDRFPEPGTRIDWADVPPHHPVSDS